MNSKQTNKHTKKPPRKNMNSVMRPAYPVDAEEKSKLGALKMVGPNHLNKREKSHRRRTVRPGRSSLIAVAVGAADGTTAEWK